MSANAAIDSQLDLILDEESLPGITWATVDGSTMSTGGRGLANLATASPMTADTKVQVGSVTKTLVAVGVLHLVSTGQLAIDADVERLLPMLNWRNPWGGQSPITIRNLLEHTAGLDNIRMWQFLNSEVTPDTPLRDAFPTNHEHLLQIRTRPGSQYSYSNMGYALLGLVIERITTERYEDYLARELLKPLGMIDSSFEFITQSQDSRLAMGYLGRGVSQHSVPLYLRPAGQFTTTANDMLHLLRFMLGDGHIDGARFVAPQYMAQLGEPSTTEAYQAGLSNGHGLALATRDRHGVLGQCHPGETFGFRAYLCLFPDERKAFFYAVNADSETADYERLNKHFIERLSVSPRSPVSAVATQDLAEYTGLYVLAPSNMAQFEWLDWMFNSVWLAEDSQKGGLMMRSLQQADRLILPLGNGLFRDAERRQASHVFFGSEDRLLSYGLTTWRRTSPVPLILGWVSLVAGVLGLLYLLLRGGWLLVRGQAGANKPLMLPWLCLISFALPVLLYTQQSYLEFGEITAASVLLAALTGLLPLLAGIGLVCALRRSRPILPDLIALTAVLQLCVVLLFQGVLPIVFWR